MREYMYIPIAYFQFKYVTHSIISTYAQYFVRLRRNLFRGIIFSSKFKFDSVFFTCVCACGVNLSTL